MNKAKTWIFDLDGTVCDDRHRIELALQGKYDKYHEKASDDMPYQPILMLLYLVLAVPDFKVLFITGRTRKFRRKTVQWLRAHNVWHSKKCDLIMRGNRDFSPAPQFKWAAIKKHFGGIYNASQNIALWLDNDERVIKKMMGFNMALIKMSAVREGQENGTN